MDTDDDCEIEYLGNRYCYYAEDLVILKMFSTREACYDFLTTEIKVVDGGKLSRNVKDYIAEFIAFDKQGKAWPGINANEFVEIVITEVTNTDPFVQYQPTEEQKAGTESVVTFLRSLDVLQLPLEEIINLLTGKGIFLSEQNMVVDKEVE